MSSQPASRLDVERRPRRRGDEVREPGMDRLGVEARVLFGQAPPRLAVVALPGPRHPPSPQAPARKSSNRAASRSRSGRSRSRRGMAIWSFCVAASLDGPDEGSGFVRADTAAEAVRLVGHPEVNVYPCHDDVEMPEGATVWFLDGGGRPGT